jgi:hypothetical protein
MFSVKSISLRGRIPAGRHIRFLSVDVDQELRQALVCVQYAIDGVRQELGLRVDLDKRISLDSLEDAEHQAEAVRAVAALCTFLYSPKAKPLIAAAKPIVIGKHVRMSPPPLQTSRSLGAYSD